MVGKAGDTVRWTVCIQVAEELIFLPRRRRLLARRSHALGTTRRLDDVLYQRRLDVKLDLAQPVFVAQHVAQDEDPLAVLVGRVVVVGLVGAEVTPGHELAVAGLGGADLSSPPPASSPLSPSLLPPPPRCCCPRSSALGA